MDDRTVTGKPDHTILQTILKSGFNLHTFLLSSKTYQRAYQICVVRI
ncbi:MAG: hypothetical protein LBQ00_00085 [Syntrophobacterales bacterium]|nr:hypothetical protein [Syntrophobacterales bacterium]